VAGMTDRYAFDKAVSELDWDPARLPRGIDDGALTAHPAVIGWSSPGSTP
jgi:hypothetical protein